MERFFLKTEVSSDKKDGKTRCMSGYAISYGVPSVREWWGYTVFQPGAANYAMQKPDLECYSLFNHDPNWVLGVTTNGSLELQDASGPGVQPGMRQSTTLTAGDTEQIDTIIAHLDSGRISRMSFAADFTPDGEQWDVVDNENVRYIKEGGIANLYDVSPVTYAKFPQSRLDQNGFVPGAHKEVDDTMRLLFRVERGLKVSRTELDTVKEFAQRLNLLTAPTKLPVQNTQPEGIHIDVLRSRFSKLFG